MPGSCYPAGYAEAMFRRMGCTIRDETSHSGFCRYSWNEDSLLDYLAYREYHAQPAASLPGYDTVAPTAPGFSSSRVVENNSETGAPRSFFRVSVSKDLQGKNISILSFDPQ